MPSVLDMHRPVPDEATATNQLLPKATEVQKLAKDNERIVHVTPSGLVMT